MTEIEKTVFDLIRAAASDLSYEIGGTVDPAALYRIVRRQHHTKASLQAVASFKENRNVMGRELRYFGISPEEKTGEEARRD